MVWAIRNKVQGVDAFAIFTDHDTWYGQLQPAQALGEYWRKHDPQAKLIVVALVSTGFSIAKPHPAAMMDGVGPVPRDGGRVRGAGAETPPRPSPVRGGSDSSGGGA